MELSRPEYWSGQPFPSPGDLPNRGMEPRSSDLQVDSLPAEPQGKGISYGRVTVGSVVPAPGGQQRDSAIHVRVSLLPQTPFPSRLGMTLRLTVGPAGYPF